MESLVKKDVEQEKKNFTEAEKAIENTYMAMKEFVPASKALRAFTAAVIASAPRDHSIRVNTGGESLTKTCKIIEAKLNKTGSRTKFKVIKDLMIKKLKELGPVFVREELVVSFDIVSYEGVENYLKYDPEKVMLYLDFN